MSSRFVVVKANAKCETETGFSESVKTAFTHLRFSFNDIPMFYFSNVNDTEGLK